MRLLLASLLACCALSAVAGCATHTVRQSTLFATPTAGAPPTSHGRADLYVGGSGTTYIETHSRDPSTTGGSWLTRGQIDGQVGIRIHRFVGIRIAGFVGLPDGAVAPDPTTLERPSAVVFGAGPIGSFGYATEDDPFFVRAEFGLSLSFMPSVLSVTDMSGPCPCPTSREEHLSFMPVVQGGLLAGYWVLPELALSGGLVLRNQPRRAFSGEFGTLDSGSAQLDFGDLAAVPWVALEVEIERAVGIVVQLQYPILGDVLFGPTISGGVRGVFGEGPSAPGGSDVDDEDLLFEEEADPAVLGVPG
jgi:hypothetical protein